VPRTSLLTNIAAAFPLSGLSRSCHHSSGLACHQRVISAASNKTRTGVSDGKAAPD
jgi:hypothetical protein